MRRSSFPAWVYLLMVFAAGTALGVVSDRLYTTKTVIANSKSAFPKSPAEYRERYMDEVKSRLKLNDQQVAEVSRILDHTDKRMQALHERDRPEFTAIHKDQVAEVRAILSNPQREEYDRMRKERQKKREAEEAKEKSGN